MINQILDLSRLWPFGSIHDSLLPSFDFSSIFADLFQGALSDLLHCKIRIKNSLKCAFLIDEQRRLQFMHHFVLRGYNVVLQQPFRISK